MNTRADGLKSYLREMSRYHDHDMEQAWIRALVRDGRVEDAEGCFG